MDVSARGRGAAGRRRSPVVKLKVANGGSASHASAPELDLKKLLRTLQAARDGDFSARLATDHTGLAGKIADTFNELMSCNQRLAEELERAGQMVGKEGKTRVRISAERRSGAWAEMESSVNTLIDDLLWPTAEVTRTITAVAKGDLTQSVGLEADGRPLKGEFLRSATVVNEMIAQMGVFTSEVTRVAREVGTEGKLGGQALVLGASGVWKDLTDNVNSMAGNLTAQVRNISEVTIAVAQGDLSRKITVDVRGEILQLKEAINTMVDQLRSFASEVTRVAREVGTEGKLGGQAIVPGIAGTWKDLTDNVNSMAGNLTGQVRNISEVTTAVARGDLSRKITVDVRGEILQLKEAINTMVDQLRSFASEVTRVAREVGTEGKLGGQAEVQGVVGHVEGSHGQRELHGREPDRPGAQHLRSDHRGGAGRPVAQDHGGRARRNPAAQGSHQHDGGPAAFVRVRSDARGARGRHRRKTRRPGARARRRGHVEGSHRQRERPGLEPDRPGAQHRGSDHRGGERRPVAQDHGRRARRNPAAQGNHQHDGGSAAFVRLRSDTRGARGRHRRQTRWPGRGAGRVGRVEGPHRQRELDGLEPDRPGAQHRRGDHRRGARRPVAQDHGGRARRNPAS